jgi:hypothetical protein
LAEPIPLRVPLRGDVFQKEVRERSKFSNMVVRTDHLLEQMEARGITFRQVLNVLRKGVIKNSPTYNAQYATYEGVMTYHGTGREINVVCAIRGSQLTVFAVTVY